MTERRRGGDRRRETRPSRDRRLAPQEEQAIEEFGRLLKQIHGPRWNFRYPGHYGNGTYKEKKR